MPPKDATSGNRVEISRKIMAELKEIDPELVLQLKEKLVSPETDIKER